MKDYTWAKKQLKEEKKVRRKSWPEKTHIIMDPLTKDIFAETGKVRVRHFETKSDKGAKDWELFEESE